ncbi:A24 family peptidase [Noviherbaspirillum sp. 1P10PC]|uniref:A24 family peptidase n=1 Tax=Noviherbaspirillum sp. 1P10PC TaxID=3132292 RepID=UPI0039A279DA
MENIVLFQDGLVLFFGTSFIELEQAALFLLVVTAALFDIKSRRIPNKLVFPGALAAIAYHTMSPYGIGFFGSMGGLAVGLAALLPLYMIRAMGAGDVKLMAMVGAFLGPMSAVGAIMTTFIAGGALAIAAAIRNKSAQRMLNNIRAMMAHALVGAATGTRIYADIRSVSAGKLPYGIAIAVGTTAHILLIKNGHALLS